MAGSNAGIDHPSQPSWQLPCGADATPLRLAFGSPELRDKVAPAARYFVLNPDPAFVLSLIHISEPTRLDVI
eukprot:2648102-Prorocentrum_lima.AAC.1